MKTLRLVLSHVFHPSPLNTENYIEVDRPIGLFHIATGGCGACGQELSALSGAAYGLARWGVEFVRTPQQAHYLLLTGALSRNMGFAVDAAWHAMPSPKGIIAVGDCALGEGIFSQNYATFGGMKGRIQADLTISGCPPSPALIGDAIMSLLHSSRHSQPPPPPQAPEEPPPLSSNEENSGG